VDAFTCLSETPGEQAYYQKILEGIAPGRSQRQIFDAHLAQLGLQDRVQAVVGDSRQAVPLVPLGPGGADLIFIDGGHDLETVRLDIQNYLPFVKPGGIVAFHDFSSTCDVPSAVWESIQRRSFSDLIGIFHTLIAFRKA
jgi:predicted O-methyltransferase YrrM